MLQYACSVDMTEVHPEQVCAIPKSYVLMHSTILKTPGEQLHNRCSQVIATLCKYGIGAAVMNAAVSL